LERDRKEGLNLTFRERRNLTFRERKEPLREKEEIKLSKRRNFVSWQGVAALFATLVH
jgi:hypothetical protein